MRSSRCPRALILCLLPWSSHQERRVRQSAFSHGSFVVRDASFAEWGTRLGWQARAASGICRFCTADQANIGYTSTARDVFFNVSADGIIKCTDDADMIANDDQKRAPISSCAPVLAAILNLTTRRVDLSEHAASGRVSELRSLDNEHLPMVPRVAVLMTGQLRTFLHAVIVPLLDVCKCDKC